MWSFRRGGSQHAEGSQAERRGDRGRKHGPQEAARILQTHTIKVSVPYPASGSYGGASVKGRG